MKIELKEYLSFRGHNFILASICFFTSFNVSALESVNFEFSRDSKNLILRFTETHGIMSGLDSVTSVKVYGNGLVKVHYPSFMKRAGDYQMMLDDVQLNELLQTLAKKNIPEFDVNQIQSEKNNKLIESKDSKKPEFFAVYDASITTIEMNFDRYTKIIDTQAKNITNSTLSGSAYDVVDLKQKISWKGLRADSKRFPNIKAIQGLSTAQKMLLEIAESDQLVKGN